MLTTTTLIFVFYVTLVVAIIALSFRVDGLKRDAAANAKRMAAKDAEIAELRGQLRTAALAPVAEPPDLWAEQQVGQRAVWEHIRRYVEMSIEGLDRGVYCDTDGTMNFERPAAEDVGDDPPTPAPSPTPASVPLVGYYVAANWSTLDSGKMTLNVLVFPASDLDSATNKAKRLNKAQTVTECPGRKAIQYWEVVSTLEDAIVRNPDLAIERLEAKAKAIKAKGD